MPKRRKVIPVSLTGEQRERLERLWFYFGNYGPKTTPGNHNFIQRLLENGVDERPLHTKRTPKSELPTPECEAAVESVLSTKLEATLGEERSHIGSLRLITNDQERIRPDAQPEIKAVLDDMERRYCVVHTRLEGDGDTPEAA